MTDGTDRSRLRQQFITRYPFPIDRFQSESFDALDRGEHVVVAVPTGSGKTVVAEYGIDAARAEGLRAFYTAPVKALSNQKYRDLVAVHGEDDVGLLTGDNSINGDAPIVVMTTEVLRNMIYGRSRLLQDLGLVVLDEVHFLQDSYRGPVWEEVMIHLPQHVRLVCLSATVSNVDELAEWIATVRGPTASIVERRRPVRLDNEYLVADRTNDRLRMLPVFIDGHVNRDAVALDESAVRGRPGRGKGPRSNGRNDRNDRGSGQGSGRKVLAPPGRVDTVGLLERRRLLPAIFFIFSRAQCDAAAKACVDAGLDLVDAGERTAIRTIVDARLGGLDEADLEVLGFTQFVAQLECGVAAHHAGMVPPMKEVVEACFVEGLVKVVFATETLAVGINMPARTVVIEKLTKFTGEHHERLTPGEYTQLTGRAGRRGIDDLGTAVVLWSPWVRFDELAELAGSSSFHLRSAFRPTYNMAANLVRTYSSDEAHHLLNLSFAQFQADRDVVRLEARLERRRAAAADLHDKAQSDYGDIEEYRRLRERERDDRAAGRAARLDAIDDALAALRPGVAIHVAKGTYKGPATVVAAANRKSGLRLTVITRSAKSLYLTAEDFDEPPRQVGKVALPNTYAPNRKEYRNDVARRLRTMKADPSPSTKRRRRASEALADSHPAARDPDLRAKLNAAGQADRIQREIADLERRVSGKNTSLASEFDRVLNVLTTYGYLDRTTWSLTEAGEMLARTFHESDLLVAEIVGAGVLDGLGAADLAALVSTLVYEHRSSDAPPAPWFSSSDTRDRWRRLAAISEDLRATERSVGLAEHRAPDPTFAAIAYAWVAGEGFAEVVGDDEMTGGDFVRTAKQLIDLLRQLALIAPDPATRRAAGDAATAAFRGVVADSAAPTPAGA
ncbi:MAG TPA: DEAD/DEAH box helicase [Ilumatobacteraceae bacterium]|nr:DEAD/DEAH box helicase [Ilumatobacteraceae bacterium]